MKEQVLIHHGKHGLSLWQVHNHAQLLRAFLSMFKRLDGYGYYKEAWLPADQRELVAYARAGNVDAAKSLIEMRNGCEYEGFTLENIETP